MILKSLRIKVPNITLIRKVLKRLGVNPTQFIQLYNVEKSKACLKKHGIPFKEKVLDNGAIKLTLRCN